MSNDEDGKLEDGRLAKLFKLMATVMKLVLDGKRTPDEVSAALQKLIDNVSVDVQQQLGSWKVFYKKYFSIDLDISTIVVPPRQPGFDRLIVVAQSMTLNGVYDICARHFPCRPRGDLNKEVAYDDRNPSKGAYAIWVRDRQEADEENKNLSADDIKKKGMAGITLLECLLHELKYYDETGQHSDLANVTLCTGSLYRNGNVPSVYWDDGMLRVHWCYSYVRNDHLRSRSAVSLPTA